MAKKKSTVNKAGNYTKPTMRKRLFNKIMAGTTVKKNNKFISIYLMILIILILKD